jgi:hypothetical protein
MPDARVKPPPIPLQKHRTAVGAILAGAAAMLLFLPMLLLLQGPSFVSKITLTNPTPYRVNVEVTGAEDDGWLDLGTVPREREITVEEVASQGDRWVFRFTSAGVIAGELELARADLERDGWRVNIPAGLAETLRAAGVPVAAA